MAKAMSEPSTVASPVASRPIWRLTTTDSHMSGRSHTFSQLSRVNPSNS